MKDRIIYVKNKLFGKYVAITIAEWFFVHDELLASFEEFRHVLRHERIHREQWRECLYIFYPILYALFYLNGLIVYRDHKKAYRNNPFEAEAYNMDHWEDYLLWRDSYQWKEWI